jgi:hypothetical protein
MNVYFVSSPAGTCISRRHRESGSVLATSGGRARRPINIPSIIRRHSHGPRYDGLLSMTETKVRQTFSKFRCFSLGTLEMHARFGPA